ncbi:DNA (cytosine-5-)-methyltransferase [Listeria monocytogenes]|nr:DNA (cytosine-5-)-methyltransferase [Listeria monocytogenes]
MKFLDLFAGIGGFRFGMESAGHECVGFVEIDKHARKSYQAIHETEGEWAREDITKITDAEWRELRGTVDVICGGFPCQAFSIAGKRLGFSETRGTLFFEIARAAKQIQPRYLFLENVKGLLSHDKGATFATILTTLDELGYDAEWQIFNSKHFGVPQNRERVFIIGHLRGERTGKVFPFGGKDTTITQNNIKVMNDPKKVKDQLEYDSINRFYDVSGIAPTLNTMQGGNREPKIAVPVLTPDRPEKCQNGRRFKEDGEEMFTLTAQDKHGVLIKEATSKGYAEAYPGDSVNISHPNSETRRGRVGKQLANTLLTGEEQGVVTEHYRIRKLTPRECWRLQGFPDWAFDRAAEVNSNSQLYKQAGNSVTVNVIAAIAKRLEETK